MPRKLDPSMATVFLFIFIVMTLFLHTPRAMMIALVIGIIGILVFKLSLKMLLKSAVFGIFLAIFIFIFNLLLQKELIVTMMTSFLLVEKFFLMIVMSFIHKKYYTNRDMAYAITRLLSGWRINQIKMYSTILLVLNQLSNMQTDTRLMYEYQGINQQKTWKTVINLIIPFTKISMLKGDQLAMIMVAKGYAVDKKVKLYHNFVNHYSLILGIIGALIIYSLLILVV